MGHVGVNERARTASASQLGTREFLPLQSTTRSARISPSSLSRVGGASVCSTSAVLLLPVAGRARHFTPMTAALSGESSSSVTRVRSTIEMLG